MSQAEGVSAEDPNGKLDILLDAYQELARESASVDLAAFLEPYPDLSDRFRQALASRGEFSEQKLQPEEETTFIAPLRPRSGNQPDNVSPLPGFDRYQIIRELGAGAMGTVHLAHDKTLSRQVAVKVPMIPAVDRADVIDRFYQEARAAASLNHPNICPVHDVGQHEGRPYMTMAYVEGQTLASVLRSGDPMSQRMVAATVRKIAMAVEEAHRMGVVHRDIKPGNIMIDARMEPILMDFGLARIYVDSAQVNRTQFGAFAGTPAYMSPEQVECDESKIGPATDIYSLGVVFYEMLTGSVPFTAVVPKVYHQIVAEEPPPLHKRDDQIDPTLEKLCLQMLCKSPGSRCKSMKIVVDQLTNFLRQKKETPEHEPNPATAAEVEDLRVRLKTRSEKVHQLIATGELFEARRLLESIATDTDPQAANYAIWARQQIETVDDRIVAKQEQATPAYHLAKKYYQQQRFVEAVRVLSSIDKPFLSPQAAQLLQESIALATEVQHLYSFIEGNLNRGKTQNLLPSIRRLLELQSNDATAKFLFRKYKWQSRFGGLGAMLANAFAPADSKRDGQNRWLARSVFAAAAVILIALISSPYLAEVWVAKSDPTGLGSELEPDVVVPSKEQVESVAEVEPEDLESEEADMDRMTNEPSVELESSQSSLIAVKEEASEPESKSEGLIVRAPLPFVESPVIPGIIPSPQAYPALGGKNWQLLTKNICHPVEPIAYSPNGKRIAIGAGPYIRIVDASNLKLQSVFVGLAGRVTDLCWRADGGQLVASDSDGRVLIWNRDGSLDRSFPDELDFVADLDWSPDHRWIAIADRQRTLVLWDPLASDVRSFVQPAILRSVAWRPDSKVLAVGHNQGTDMLRLGERAEVIHSSKVSTRHLRWNPKGTAIAGRRSREGLVVLHADGKIKWEAKLDGWGHFCQLAWSPDGKQLAAGRSPAVHLYDTQQGKLIRTIAKNFLQSADWRKDGAQVVVAGHDGMVETYVTRTWKRSARLAPARNASELLAWAPSSVDFAAAQNGSEIAFWNVNGKCRIQKNVRSDTGLAWSSSGDKLLVARYDGVRQLLDKEGKVLKVLESKPLGGSAGVGWSKSERMFGGGHTACGEWGPNGNLKSICRDLPAWSWPTWVESLQSVAAAQQQHGILLWNPNSGEKTFLKTPIHANRVEWNELSSSFLVSDNHRFALMNPKGDVKFGPIELPHHADQIQWHPSGDRLMISDRRRITILQTDGEVIDSFSNHTQHVHASYWSPDGRSLLSAADDSLLILRDGTTFAPRWVGVRVGSRHFTLTPIGSLLEGSKDEFAEAFLCLLEGNDGNVEVLTTKEFAARIKGKHSVSTSSQSTSKEVQPISINSPSRPADPTATVEGSPLLNRTTPAGARWTDRYGNKFRYCPTGEFESLRSDLIKLTQPFLMAETEVTRKQWASVMGTKPWTSDFGSGNDDHPATHMIYAEAREFTRRLNSKAPRGLQYVLPSEAMWEYACRAGTKEKYFFGNDENRLHEHGCFEKASLQPVGKFKPNPWGLFDMLGNAREIVFDSWTEKPATGVNPLPKLNLCRGQVTRGMHFAQSGIGSTTVRARLNPFKPHKDSGIRVAIIRR